MRISDWSSDVCSSDLYTGMAAMRGPVELNYDRLWVALSVIIAIGAATAAVWLTFRTTGQQLAAAIIMGLAISGMHYTGMRAAVFTAHATMEDEDAREDARSEERRGGKERGGTGRLRGAP